MSRPIFKLIIYKPAPMSFMDFTEVVYPINKNANSITLSQDRKLIVIKGKDVDEEIEITLKENESFAIVMD